MKKYRIKYIAMVDRDNKLTSAYKIQKRVFMFFWKDAINTVTNEKIKFDNPKSATDFIQKIEEIEK